MLDTTLTDTVIDGQTFHRGDHVVATGMRCFVGDRFHRRNIRGTFLGICQGWCYIRPTEADAHLIAAHSGTGRFGVGPEKMKLRI